MRIEPNTRIHSRFMGKKVGNVCTFPHYETLKTSNNTKFSQPELQLKQWRYTTTRVVSLSARNNISSARALHRARTVRIEFEFEFSRPEDVLARFSRRVEEVYAAKSAAKILDIQKFTANPRSGGPRIRGGNA